MIKSGKVYEKLYEKSRATFEADPDAAQAMAFEPLGPDPAKNPAALLASWTVISNIVLNLDETLAPR